MSRLLGRTVGLDEVEPAVVRSFGDVFGCRPAELPSVLDLPFSPVTYLSIANYGR